MKIATREEIEGFVSKLKDIVGENLSKLDSRHLLLTVSIIQFLVIGVLLTDSSEPADNAPQLTKYQQEYVDCPSQYLEACTSLSKVPTQQVTFDRVEDNKIYLEMEDGRTMIARLNGKQDPKIIAMK